ncbi:MAG: hypothetical protein IPO98_08135 [Saprospiraceae bacterium]|nr:hypothetical protein [Saprospiraceae bacterium]
MIDLLEPQDQSQRFSISGMTACATLRCSRVDIGLSMGLNLTELWMDLTTFCKNPVGQLIDL